MSHSPRLRLLLSLRNCIIRISLLNLHSGYECLNQAAKLRNPSTYPVRRRHKLQAAEEREIVHQPQTARLLQEASKPRRHIIYLIEQQRQNRWIVDRLQNLRSTKKRILLMLHPVYLCADADT